MSDLFLWAADNVPLWRPFAIALLAGFVLACLWYALAAWEATR